MIRLLLTTITGATSWDYLCTFEGTLHPTFKASCMARGLLEDDQEWQLCLQEATEVQPGAACRRLFAIILQVGRPTQPELLWERFRKGICDDLGHCLRQMTRYADRDIPEPDIYNYGLHLLNKILINSGFSPRRISATTLAD
jgi:hypothetical protein